MLTKTTAKQIFLGIFLPLMTLVACGGGGSIPLGSFPNISKTEGDAPFALTAPQSKSPVPFVFASSDPSVAAVSGSTVTILLAGTTTITASQPSQGTWSSSSTSAVLTVAPIACTDPLIRVSGKCVAKCTAPATRQNGICVATSPASTNYVTGAGRLWMPVASIDTWNNASAFCSGTTINGQTGWRLPNKFEIDDLYASGLMNGQGWTLNKTWSSTAGLDSANRPFGHQAIDLSNGATISYTDDTGAYYSCVR